MKKKIMTICLVVCLAATAIVGGTLAYFSDTTEKKVNTFTVGNVDIDLSEPDWDFPDGANLMPGTIYEKNPTITVQDNSQDSYVFLEMEMNKYVSLINLMGVDAYKNNIGDLERVYPGFTVFATKLLEDDALRANVVDRWFGGIDHNVWKIMNLDELKTALAGAAKGQNPTSIKMVLGYKGTAEDNGVLSAGDSITFMTQFGMPATVTTSMFDGEDAYRINGVSKSNFNTKEADFRITFTAYAIQKAEIADLEAAYEALF